MEQAVRNLEFFCIHNIFLKQSINLDGILLQTMKMIKVMKPLREK